MRACVRMMYNNYMYALQFNRNKINTKHAPSSPEYIRNGNWVVLRKRAPKCDIELFALDLLVLVANRLVQCATYTV